MKETRIAILGSTSHIAKGLINNFLLRGEVKLSLYARAPRKIYDFLESIEKIPNNNCIVYEGYGDFVSSSHDVVINCVGVGTLNRLQGNYSNYFVVTEEFDNLAIECLRNNCPDALYISLSSGAVYGRNFSGPVGEGTVNNLRVNHIEPEDYYCIVRLNAEAKHRSFKDLRIVDLRLFSYFSRFIDLKDGYFITEVLDCILKGKVLVTNNMNIVRDYVHPDDLFSIINKCIQAGKINAAFDVNSSKPVEKREILDYFTREYGLKYETSESLCSVSATGTKNIYCSTYNRALEIGYNPEFSSMDSIELESNYILRG